MTRLSIYLFGTPRIELNRTLIKLSRHKAVALLAYLAINPEAQSRNFLATLLWPNQDQTRARAALRRTLMTLKNAGVGQWLEATRETISLIHNEQVWVDVLEFQYRLGECLAAGDDPKNDCLPLLTKALDLYRANFLSGFTLRDSPDFDEWQYFQTENLRHDLSSVLARLVRIQSRMNNFETAITYARRWVEMDPLYELAHRQLMELYVWYGQRPAALRQYQACVQILADELDTPPSEETLRLYERIKDNDLEGQDDPKPTFYFPTKQSTSSSLVNFPAQPTPFLGRTTELAEIAARLQNVDCRLVSLIGPGGIGKTRLAIQAGLAQKETFSDGLYFIPLASLASPDFVLPAIMDTLNLTLDGREDPLPQLLSYLRHKHLLLVVDNFEHLINKVDVLAEILQHAPHTKILATSRERLNLQGEWTVEIKGMEYPTGDTLEDVEGYSAVALFLHRAYRVHSDFILKEEDKPYIVKICQQMGGIPLGLELAASWVRVLSCREIAWKIEQMYRTPTSLEFLTTTLHDVPERHQNLTQVFEHSWQLLSSKEQRALCKLSVFQGSYQREAIEGVTKASLPLIMALVDKSLLTRRPSGRYEMHQLLRQFVTEKLHQSAHLAEQARDQHSDYYTIFLERRRDHLRGPNQKKTLTEIAREIENIRVGWQWAIVQGRMGQVEQALKSLWLFYAMYGWFQEGLETFARIIPLLVKRAVTQENTILHGRVLACLGWFFMRQGYYEYAQDVFQKSIAMLKDIGEKNYIANSLHYLGILITETADFSEAQPYLQEALTLYRQTNNLIGVAWTLSNLGYRAEKLTAAKFEEAQSLLRESLTIYKTIGDQQGIAVALNNLGYITYQHEDFTEAKRLLEESLALRRKIGFPRGIAVTLNNLGHVAGKLKDYAVSKVYHFEALKIAKDIQAQPLALAALGGVALPYFYEGNQPKALQLIHLSLQHPASNEETKNRAREALQIIQSELSSSDHILLDALTAQSNLLLDNLFVRLVKEALAEENQLAS